MRLHRCLVLLLLVRAANAQVSGGTISGTVSDPAAAVIAGADVVIENTATHEVRKIASGSTGFYSAANLAPGTYELKASAPGFSSLVRKDLEVQVGAELVINVQLKVGAATEQIEVTESAPEVDTASSTLGAVNTGQTVRELPLNGRDWTTLAALQPGVSIVRTENGAGLSASRGNRGLGTMMAIGGARPQQNNYRLDGVSVNDYAGGGPASVLGVSLGVDAIQEFSVVTGNASADYGKTSGGVVNAVTRAGTNDLHGSVYEFLRNSALDARNFFDTTTAPPPFKRNQFGGSVGGAVIKDKTFFFADYEGVRQGLGVTTVDTVPSPAARAGQLVAGNITVSPKVAPFLALFPLPNVSTKGDTGTYAFASQDNTTENFFTSRGDHHFSDRDILHGTFLVDNGQTSGPDIFNDVLLGTDSQRKTANMEESHVFSPSAINFARIGFNRIVAEQVKSLSVINPAASDLSLGFMPGRPVGGINVAGLTLFPGGLGAAGDYKFSYTSYQVYDDFSLTTGAHSLKIGGSFERIQSNGLGAGTNNGTATFGSISGFLQNQPTSFSATIPGTGVPTGLRQSIMGAYVQDDWRIRRNLTLNLGLRYEPATVPTEEHDRLATLVWGSQQLKIGSPYFQNPSKRNFSPRLGWAWDPFGDGKTSIRGGFGLYDSLPLTSLFSLIAVLSAPYNEQGSSVTVPVGSFPNGLANTLAAGNGLRAAFVDQNPHRNYVLQWNLNLQRQLASNLVLEVGYAGSHGVHSPLIVSDINTALPTATPLGYVWPTPKGSGAKPWPNFGNATSVIWQVSSTYDALRMKLQKRLSRGLQLQGSYTFAKSLDTGSTSVQAAFTNSVTNMPYFDSHIRKAPSDFDVRHNLSLNGTWEIPGAASQMKPVAWVTHGWQLGSIVTVSAGHPFTAIVAGDALGLNSSVPYNYPDRLNLPGCSTPVNPGNPNAYIKLSCFAAPTPATRLGNAGRNVLVGPGLFDWDASVFKNNHITRISETFNIQFRAELFNIMNHTNFSTPLPAGSQLYTVNLAPIPSAGTLTATSTTSRQMQFAIKIIW
jgi:hypothetical protein